MNALFRKTIQVNLSLTSGIEDYALCESIENMILKSSFSSAEFDVKVHDVRVTHRELATYNGQDSRPDITGSDAERGD